MFKKGLPKKIEKLKKNWFGWFARVDRSCEWTVHAGGPFAGKALGWTVQVNRGAFARVDRSPGWTVRAGGLFVWVDHLLGRTVRVVLEGLE